MKPVKLEIRGISVVLILGAALILSSAYYLMLEYFTAPFDKESAATILSYIVLFLVGVWMIINRDMSGHRCIYLCGMALGVATILQNIFFMSYDDYAYMFFLGFLTSLLGFAEMAFSVAYLFQYRRYVVKLCVVVGCQMAMGVIPMVIDWYSEMTVTDILIMYSSIFPMMFVNVVFVWILTRKGIWIPFPTKRIENNLIALEPVLHSDRDVYMTPESLERLLDRDNWPVVNLGPVEKEVKVDLLGGDSKVQLLVQLLKDDPVPHVKLIPSEGGQFIQGPQFEMVQSIVSEARDNIRIYGNEGVFINIQVRSAPVKRKGLLPHHTEDAPDEETSEENPE